MRIGLFSTEQTFIRCRNKDITGLVHIWTQMLKTWIASSQINCSTERTEVCRVPSLFKMQSVAISCWQKEVSVLQWSTPGLINHTPRWSHSPEQLANTREFSFLQWSTSGFINHTPRQILFPSAVDQHKVNPNQESLPEWQPEGTSHFSKTHSCLPNPELQTSLDLFVLFPVPPASSLTNTNQQCTH